MKFIERRCWESECTGYLIIEYLDARLRDGICFAPLFEGSLIDGFSLDTLDGAKAQCEAHKEATQ